MAACSHMASDGLSVFMHGQSVQVHLQNAKVIIVIHFNTVDCGRMMALTMLTDTVKS